MGSTVRHLVQDRRRSKGALLALALLAGVLSMVAVTVSPAAVSADPTSAPGTISAGKYFACAVTDANAAVCWGRNTAGQLGNGGTITTSTPTPVTGLSADVTSVSAGDGHACAVVAGTAGCWGTGTSGQLGDGTSNNSTTVVGVSGLSSGVTDVAAGADHSCAVVDGAAVCWGGNANGQLGNGSITGSAIPVQVQGLTSGVTSVTAGTSSSCAVVDGAAVCWGLNANGQLGNGSATASSTPVQVTGLVAGVTLVDAGTAHTCAVVSGGAWCWGSGANGRLGQNSGSSSVPVQPLGLSSGVTDISAGLQATCAVSLGDAWCWGWGPGGELGDSFSYNLGSNTPVRVSGFTSDVTSITAGENLGCGIAIGGDARCWGIGTDGSLGSAVTRSSDVPVPVEGLAGAVTKVSANWDVSCGIVGTDMSCWGLNTAGQAGFDMPRAASVPVASSSLGTGVTSMSSGLSFSCAVVSGAAKCFGSNAANQNLNTLGDPNGASGPTPVQVLGLTSGVTEVSTGFFNTCAIASGGAQCWGRGTDGQLGDGAGTSAKSPVQVQGLTSGVTDIDVGPVHACAVVSGEAWCWGAGGDGQLGHGAAASSTVPVKVQGLPAGVTSVGVGYSHSCAVASGAAWCWGRGDSGQLGDGASANSLVPVAVSSLTSGVTVLSAESTRTCAVASGSVACWGTRINGSSGFSATPVVAQGLESGVTALEVGNGTACAAKSGAAWCWGSDMFGALGVDTYGTHLVSGGYSYLVPNQAPVADDQSIDVARGASTTITFSGSDPDGDPIDFEVLSQPGKGTLDCVANVTTCDYTPGSGQSGTDSFTFRADDGQEVSETATVTITITNQAPTAAGQTLAANAPTFETPVTLAATDPNGDALTFGVTVLPQKGIVNCESDGSCTYRANPGSTGTDSFTFTADDGFGGTTAPATVTLQLDGTTPGVFLGAGNKLEPDSGNVGARGLAVPVTLSTPSPVPLTVWYATADGTATNGVDYSRWGSLTAPRSIVIPAGATWATIAPPVRTDAVVESDETFDVRILDVTGGPAYIGRGVSEQTIRDASSVSRTDPSQPVLSISSIAQVEGNAATSASRKAQLRVELSKPLTTTLTLRWSTVAGTAAPGTDFLGRSKVLLTFKPGQVEASIDLTLLADQTAEVTESFQVALASITGGDVAVANSSGTVAILDEDGF